MRYLGEGGDSSWLVVPSERFLVKRLCGAAAHRRHDDL
jgi:hypothetical protein